ncbi:MAG: hypothetical protein IPH12_08010 [Saprospirales bacterium]|nr:hypothetical protein [Saprospirales bacterium]MBK8920778.1 hypothetical protein [Saprospirales bacterium]
MPTAFGERENRALSVPFFLKEQKFAYLGNLCRSDMRGGELRIVVFPSSFKIVWLFRLLEFNKRYLSAILGSFHMVIFSGVSAQDSPGE